MESSGIGLIEGVGLDGDSLNINSNLVGLWEQIHDRSDQKTTTVGSHVDYQNREWFGRTITRRADQRDRKELNWQS